jgi:hypothetical protein
MLLAVYSCNGLKSFQPRILTWTAATAAGLLSDLIMAPGPVKLFPYCGLHSCSRGRQP